ncbi:hypothetical protein GO755_38485 [Spirosoma sp. HMF4905]|uniref:Uncharacterized protein n=1 Tax=Spirosoma arboris TaxID=2682092 RepID=A0A7K1SQ76_9BACT|nr:hypothetical protein [Spirosoma arboris]MVM35965.1 hypothetical protein [Spirosoma arboris]
MKASMPKSSLPSFEYRLMEGLHKAIPGALAFIEVDNPSFQGRLITICDEAADITIQHKLLDTEVNEWRGDSEQLYISLLIEELKVAFNARKKAL